MFTGDDFKISAKASSTLGKPADSVRSDTALRRFVGDAVPSKINESAAEVATELDMALLKRLRQAIG